MRTSTKVAVGAMFLLALPALAERNLVHVNTLNPPTVRVADMPGTVDFFTQPAVAGPVAVANDTALAARGSALVGPTGGAVFTPEQRATAEIRQLIRKLGD